MQKNQLIYSSIEKYSIIQENQQENCINDIIFMGGIDTQELLTFGKPNEIEQEVNRVRDALGNGFIISPSHEVLLSNVSIKNVMAMSRAAKSL